MKSYRRRVSFAAAMEVHDFLLHRNWVRAYRASVEFFDRHLK